MSVCVSLRSFVCLLLRYRCKVFLPHFPKLDIQNFRDLESLGKSNGKKWSQVGIFFGSGSGLKFCLTKHGGNHASRWIRDLSSKGVLLILQYFYMFLSFCALDDFFLCFSKHSGFWVFLVHLETMLPDGLDTFGRRAYR